MEIKKTITRSNLVSAAIGVVIMGVYILCKIIHLFGLFFAVVLLSES